jgi:hypothetical protein
LLSIVLQRNGVAIDELQNMIRAHPHTPLAYSASMTLAGALLTVDTRNEASRKAKALLEGMTV